MQETPQTLNDCAASLASTGQHPEAVACLKRAILLEPDSSVLWFNLALSYRALGEIRGARDALLRAMRGDPLDVDTIDTLAVVQHELGEDSNAEQAYLRALDLAPQNGRVWNNYGVLQFSQKRYNEAVQSFEKAVTLIPDFADALYNLRDTYDELGNIPAREICRTMLQKVEAVSPGVNGCTL